MPTPTCLLGQGGFASGGWGPFERATKRVHLTRRAAWYDAQDANRLMPWFIQAKEAIWET